MKLDTIIAVNKDNKICNFYHKFNDNYWFCQLRDTGDDMYVCFVRVKDPDPEIGDRWVIVDYFLYGSEYDLKMDNPVDESMRDHIDKLLNNNDYMACNLGDSVLAEFEDTDKCVTNRRLARWLALGYGELQRDRDCNVITHLSYEPESAYDPVPEEFRVRRWSDDGWYIPTEEYISVSE